MTISLTYIDNILIYLTIYLDKLAMYMLDHQIKYRFQGMVLLVYVLLSNSLF